MDSSFGFDLRLTCPVSGNFRRRVFVAVVFRLLLPPPSRILSLFDVLAAGAEHFLGCGLRGLLNGALPLRVELSVLLGIGARNSPGQLRSESLEILKAYFFVLLACHKLELGGFDQHCQATVHFPLTSINFPSDKITGTLGIEPAVAG